MRQWGTSGALTALWASDSVFPARRPGRLRWSWGCRPEKSPACLHGVPATGRIWHSCRRLPGICLSSHAVSYRHDRNSGRDCQPREPAYPMWPRHTPGLARGAPLRTRKRKTSGGREVRQGEDGGATDRRHYRGLISPLEAAGRASAVVTPEGPTTCQNRTLRHKERPLPCRKTLTNLNRSTTQNSRHDYDNYDT